MNKCNLIFPLQRNGSIYKQSALAAERSSLRSLLRQQMAPSSLWFRMMCYTIWTQDEISWESASCLKIDYTDRSSYQSIVPAKETTFCPGIYNYRKNKNPFPFNPFPLRLLATFVIFRHCGQIHDRTEKNIYSLASTSVHCFLKYQADAKPLVCRHSYCVYWWSPSIHLGLVRDVLETLCAYTSTIRIKHPFLLFLSRHHWRRVWRYFSAAASNFKAQRAVQKSA